MQGTTLECERVSGCPPARPSRTALGRSPSELASAHQSSRSGARTSSSSIPILKESRPRGSPSESEVDSSGCQILCDEEEATDEPEAEVADGTPSSVEDTAEVEEPVAEAEPVDDEVEEEQPEA